MISQQNLLIKNPEIFVTSEANVRLFKSCLNNIASLFREEDFGSVLRSIVVCKVEHPLFQLNGHFSLYYLLIVYNRKQ